ncbi:MAG: DUF4270 family protein [Bacteroidota bacterium]
MKSFSFLHFFSSFFFFLFLVFGCTDPITVGSELLSSDRATTGFDASVPIDLRTVPEDSIIVFDASISADLSRSIIGVTEDPIFGRTTRSTYVIFSPALDPTGATVDIPDFTAFPDSFDVDSIVLILPIDTIGLYGNVIGNPIEYRVNEITEPLDREVDFLSNSSLTISNTPLAEGSFIPQNFETLLHDTLIRESTLDIHVRIPMGEELIDRFENADTSAYATSGDFREALIEGVFIEPTTVNNGTFAFNHRSFNAKMNVYYSTPNNREKGFYAVDVNLSLPNFRFDRNGSRAEELLNLSLNNETSLLEGAGGLMTEVEIFLDSLDGFNYDQFAPAEFITLYYRDADGRLILIEDETISAPGTRVFFIGGELEEEDGRFVYRVNLSVHLQRIIDEEIPPVVYIRTIPTQTNPARAIMIGPDASEFPMRLKVAFTDI